MIYLTVISAIGAGVFSFFLGLLMERYKNRRLELTNTITFQKIGIPADSFLPGELEVKYNDRQVNSLYLFKLLIKNTSNFDSKELPINFFTDIDSYILSYSWVLVPHTTRLIESKDYSTRVQKYIQDVTPIFDANPNDIIPEPLNSEGLWLHRNRELIASSLNRKEEIELTVLAGSQIHDHQPYLYLNVPYSGVILLTSVDPVKENERIGKISIGIGIALTLILGAFYTLSYSDQSTQFIVLSIIGALNFLLGITIYKIFSFIHSYFK